LFRGYPTEFAGSTQNSKKMIGTPNLPIRTNFFPKKNYVSYLKSVKEPIIRLGANRRNLQAQPKMLKKIVGTSNQNFLKKSMFSSLKVKRSQKLVWELPDGICSGSLKNNRTQGEVSRLKEKKSYADYKISLPYY
jgi:hypothetical protein